MNNIKFLFGLVIALFAFTGCEFLGDVFKAGIWVGVIAVAVVVAIIWFIISRFRK